MTAKINPFASRYIRPGALEYHCRQGESIDLWVEQFCRMKERRAAIVGPHGSGKSTLLHSMVPRLGSVEWTWDASAESSLSPPPALTMDGRELNPSSLKGTLDTPKAFEQVRWFRASASSRDASPLFNDSRKWNSKCLLVVDGYEQLSLGNRWKLWRLARRTKVGLLVTSHSPLFFYPTLLKTYVNEDSAEYVVRRLLSNRNEYPDNFAEKLLRSDRWLAIRERWKSNLRESLFELYDWMETPHG